MIFLKKEFKEKHFKKTVITKRVKTGVPFLFTFANALFGFLSIIKTIEGDFLAAALCIIAAVIMDGCDGRLARYFNTSGELGSELDSLCDAISFCLAPCVLLYSWYLHHFNIIGLFGVVLGLYLCAGLFRLARFNTLIHDDLVDQSVFYSGLPSTIAAFFIAVLIAYDASLVDSFMHRLLTAKIMAGLIVVLALLMISTFSFPVFKKIKLQKYSLIVYAQIVGLSLLIAWFAYHGYPVLIVILISYIAGAVGMSIYKMFK